MGSVASISDKVGDLGAYLREQRENARLSVRQLATMARERPAEAEATRH